MDNFKKSNKQIERLTATLILTPFPRRLRMTALPCVKCVGEDNVIDPLQRWLKQKRSRVYKRAIFFMNREKQIYLVNALSQADFYRPRSLALGASA